MSRKAEKGCNNPFYMARLRAASVNDRLASRFSACGVIATSEKRLTLIENGITDPHPDEVLMMSKEYNAPELENYYCSTVCPLRAVPAIEDKTLSEIAISALIFLENAKNMQREILDIAADKKISEDEKIRVKRILDSLDEATKVKEEMEALLRTV